ncbi:hypothetical protein EDB81DRAFT_872415 [Dactylonectria macrodidyma]|uniref:Rhodopsin domain-containing protein n=1 Tax=Dactylonectria macrodidyma TaxID=307937 RepID=A0A9P9DTG2_9HYPO|nr:hypothetical protein EDB81DRAFT_872415 [Dactylonectria macrodidyma]
MARPDLTAHGVPDFLTAPPGYEVDFDHPLRKNDVAAYISAGVGLFLAFLFFAQFLYVKLWVLRKADGEAACLTLSWIFSIATQAILIRSFYNRLMGLHVWEMTLVQFDESSKIMVLTPILYAVETGFAKASLIVFYYKLSPQKLWKWSIYGVFFLVVGYNTAIFFAIIFACKPLQKNWKASMSGGTCINRPAIYVATAALGILTDLVLLVMPIPMIVRLQMPSPQKTGLILLFIIGSATLVTSIVRMVLLLPILRDGDVTWAISGAVVWIFVESNLLIICASLTTLRRFFIHLAPRLIGERGSSAGHHLSGSAGGHRHPFKTIGSHSALKKVDKFGMTVDEQAGFDLQTIGQAAPTERAVVGKGKDNPERVTTKRLRRQESVNKFGDESSEVQILDEHSAARDDVDVERVII